LINENSKFFRQLPEIIFAQGATKIERAEYKLPISGNTFFVLEGFIIKE
jgi:hypothetical protein